MEIRAFAVEQWMNAYETRCEWNLAETCVESLTVAELLRLAGHEPDWLDQLLSLKLTYGAIEGSERLRRAVAGLYDRQQVGNVCITHGAIGANHLVYLTLVEPGDRVLSVVPTYQQHWSIPESLGADVTTVRLREEAGWLPDLDELAAAIDRRTKLVVLNNPNNPTGSVIPDEGLAEIVGLCDAAGAWLLCDEVYRGIDQADPGTSTSVADLYHRGISTGSMSKAFSLAGLRLGWIVAGAALLERVMVHRDYNTISVGMIDDALACVALEAADAVLQRNRAIVRTNLDALATWVDGERSISFVRPSGGTTALLRYEAPADSHELCVRLLDETGVLLTPGSALGMEGYLRIGYANNEAVLAAGLPRISDFLHAAVA